ncbi:MAG TPA: NUDIX domain-containing protein [Salinivirgaceae bacterium]|nr:NUDIX domain-containing protein [Salinivirgaceae bacterium]
MKSISKQTHFLLSFIPLLIYIAAEYFLPMKQAAAVAIITGIVTFISIKIFTGVFDRFLFYDTLLLTLLGIASTFWETDRFMAFKPALSQILVMIYLAIPLFIVPSQFSDFIERTSLGLMQLNQQQSSQLRKNFIITFYLLGLHTLLLIYGGFYWKTNTCIVVSIVGIVAIPVGILFYNFFLTFVNRFREHVPIVDEQGNVTGKIIRQKVHNGSKLLHPVVHCHIINSNGQLFLQQRSKKAETQPGKWDTAVGGHVRWTETIEKALLREMKEETSLYPENLRSWVQYIWENEIEKELVFSFIEITNHEPKINKNEAETGRWWTLSQIRSQPSEIFTPNLLHELSMLEKLKLLK